MKKIMILAIIFLALHSLGSADQFTPVISSDSSVVYCINENIDGENGGKEYIVFIDNEIIEASQYRGLILFMGKLSEKDVVVFRIFTPGGSAYTSIMIYNAIMECKAKTIADIHIAYSGGAIIAMGCDELRIHRFSRMLVHGYQLGGLIFGSVDKLRKDFTDIDKESDDVIERIFENFLTRNQLRRVLDGEDLFLNEYELQKLIEKRNEKK